MGDDSTRDIDQVKPEPCPAGTEGEQAVEEEVGDFITGHILEKDTVFFEG